MISTLPLRVFQKDARGLSLDELIRPYSNYFYRSFLIISRLIILNTSRLTKSESNHLPSTKPKTIELVFS